MSPRSRFAIGASVVSFVFVALVAATPGSPFSPVLPSPPAGPVTALAELVGLDALRGGAIAAVGVVAVALAAAAFLFVLLECWRGSIAPRTVIGLAIAYHVVLLLLPLLFSRDVYSYAYYGRIASRYHANPYVATPIEFPSDPLAAFVGPKWVDTPAVYGPLWTQASALVVRVVDSVAAQVAVFRIVAIAASLATMFVVAGRCGASGPNARAFAAALVGLNPVVLFQSAASGHNDLLVALAIAAALALVFSGGGAVGDGALGARRARQGDGGRPLAPVVGGGRRAGPNAGIACARSSRTSARPRRSGCSRRSRS